MEQHATTVPVEEELGLGWPPVYMPLDRDNLPTRVTRQCPRGPTAMGLGPDGSGVRDAQGWTGLMVRTYGEPGDTGHCDGPTMCRWGGK